ncbi:ABC transporter ATP-binding protein [Herbivorax sp. ANBcel31]|uniref:ABC transporter ATP-binding protein n=1 Tax=Herbivorax sp. ANBcel31 TaxID=3069754 RepID=UPI0027B19D69|nr:ABC transporter ATP-binding protein [Herbivorax sp. ANBcel31]MDQ2086978.1 ABC transporter ATP-binding protein [Herbivorax sp. ANBcel31]
MEEKSMINIKGLHWSYGNEKVLDDIDIDFSKNNIYGIIGPNGSGKTTLLKNITRSLMPKNKSIYLFEKDIIAFSNRELAKIISYVPQNTSLEFEFSVMDIVLMGRTPYLKRLQSESFNDIEIAENSMKMTNTWKLRNKNIGNISGGERQRVIIARALSQQSEIMLLDEPVSQLDIHHQVEILNILKSLKLEKKVTVIMSLHDLNLASQYCDKLILMDEGKIVKKGFPKEVIKRENIEKVYGIKVDIIKNPINEKPHIILY